jgi:hypothetical protein
MAARAFPRYFVARGSTAGAPPREVAPISSMHALDSFFVGGHHVKEREWIVTVDQAGELNLYPGEDKSVFSAEVQSEVAYSEMTGSGGRLMDSSEFFLFNVQLLEQPGDAPGLNDPVYLYGTLYGPFPFSDPRRQPAGIDGQLTVTRGDLLDGLIAGSKYAFCTSPEGTSARNFHITLAGDREEEIDRGTGLVLAYPLLPGDMMESTASNELVVMQLLYDVLNPLREDMIKEKVSSPLAKMTLPVPNRFMVEEQLKQRGYTIEGDTAVIKTTVRQGFQGFLASTFGSIMADRLEIPPQGRLDEYLEIASVAMKAFKGWPPKRIWALRKRVSDASTDVRMRASRYCESAAVAPREVRTPVASNSQPATTVGAAQSGSTSGASPPARTQHSNTTPRNASGGTDGPLANWMRDFVDGHQKPGAAPARLTSTGPPPCTPKPPASKVKTEWMNDFASTDHPVPNETSDSKRPAKEVESPKKEKKSSSPQKPQPDWMKDFE